MRERGVGEERAGREKEGLTGSNNFKILEYKRSETQVKGSFGAKTTSCANCFTI